MRTCNKCGEQIRNPDVLDTCVDDHPERDTRMPMFLHDTCPCPVHGWDSDREYHGNSIWEDDT